MANQRKRKKEKDACWFLGRAAVLVCVFMAFIFAVMLISTKLLPTKLVVLVALALLLVVVLVALLIWQPWHRGRFVVGMVFAVVLCVLFGVGASYVHKTVDTAREVTTVRTETAAVGIYVRADDTNDFSAVAGSYVYGILSELDRENTNDAIAQINEEYGIALATKTYDGLPQLIDGLFASEVDAIILNSAYIEMLSEMEGYEDAGSRLREVQITHVERQVVVEPKATEVPEGRLVGVTEAESESGEEGMIFTVFISGIDTRGALTEKSRSDVNILASINTATRQIVLISTPRDYYVPLSISNGARDKLTHAGIYGVQVCMDTMELLYNVNVDYYFRVNFGGFVDIIDALGGITVNSEVSFSTDHYTFYQGENAMDGTAALEFVRERYAFASGDRQRGKNQMAVIRGVIDKALSPELLMNYNSVLSAVEGSFETSIPYDTLSTIVREQLDKGGQWNIVSYSVDGTGDSQIPYSMSQYAYVMVPNESTVETAKGLIAQVYTGQTVTAP